MMSDIDRNVGFGATMTQAETAAIDAGLRSYMRRVYNYMMIGLAITGAAALGLYLLSVTGTVADASYVIRAGRVIPVASFGALSLWGYTTQRDLSGLGSFAIMGLFGIIIASLVNGFLASSALQWGISVIGVLVFSGLTAWDTQRLKSEYLYGAMDGEAVERSAILGALSLYLDFTNLSPVLTPLLGQRKEKKPARQGPGPAPPPA